MSDQPDDPAGQELKSERVQLLMSPSEVKAIDDWGWGKRIRSRAESIRRLAQIGIVADQRLPQLTELLMQMAYALHRTNLEKPRLSGPLAKMFLILISMDMSRNMLQSLEEKSIDDSIDMMSKFAPLLNDLDNIPTEDVAGILAKIFDIDPKTVDPSEYIDREWVKRPR